jgi:hypothetical protein
MDDEQSLRQRRVLLLRIEGGAMHRSRDGTVLCDWKSRFGKACLPGDSGQCIGCSAEMGIPSPPMFLGRCRRSCTDALADLDILRFSKSLDPSTFTDAPRPGGLRHHDRSNTNRRATIRATFS